MHWRNSVLFFVVLWPALAVGGLLTVLFFGPALSTNLPFDLVLVLAVVGLIGAFIFGVRLRRRLHDLHTFVHAVQQGNSSPSVPVWGDDEIGVLETDLPRVVARQYERMRALQGERKKLEAVLQSMAEGVVVIDPAGNVSLCNRTWQEWFGLRPETEWQGKPLHNFSRHPLLQELLREVAGRRPSDQPVRREVEIDGARERRSLAVSAMQVCEDGVTVSGYVLVFHDLTQVKRLESVRADFVANVSHELRTPLTAIKGYAETLLNGALGDPDTARRFLAIIDRHSERLSRLLEDLLTLSDLELGKTALRQDEVALAEVVGEVFDVVQEKAERGGVTLVQEIPEDLPMLTGDGDRLHQVLINLTDNAVKYTPAGGTVTVTARMVSGSQFQVPGLQSAIRNLQSAIPSANGEWVEMVVSDTGCGIPESEIPRLTQRFYRVDKARSRELGGTGLGLAIVKHIVQAHGGFLQIESQLNYGTTVRLFLPLRMPVFPAAEQHIGIR